MQRPCADTAKPTTIYPKVALDSNAHAYSYSHCDTNTYTYCEPDTSAYSDTKAAPNAASSPDPVKISSRQPI